MNDAFRFIEDIWPVSEGLKSDLRDCLERREIKRNEILLTPGQVSRYIYFVSKGLLMKWHHNGVDTITTGFSNERAICLSCSSFFDQVAAMEFIQAMENTVVFCISYKTYSDLIGRYREFGHICRKLLVRTVNEMEDYTNGVSRRRAMEKYLWFKERYPGLELRVAGRYIAQFLGMTNVTFCIARSKANELKDPRIRKSWFLRLDRL